MAFNFRSVCRQISAVKWVKVSAAVSAIAGWPPSASSAMLKDHESGWVGQKAINNMLRPQNQQMQRRPPLHQPTSPPITHTFNEHSFKRSTQRLQHNVKVNSLLERVLFGGKVGGMGGMGGAREAGRCVVAPKRKQSCRTALVVRSFHPLVFPASRILCHSTTMLADDVLWNGTGISAAQTGEFPTVFEGKLATRNIVMD
uniref:HDC12671 n=1 Tax=Drosophila melanogaster TaxID=7227 RepID=Q6IKE3_DROME|nr:TPA_inf: HDC12671 [Drosophila melanogaster]